jgi:hypothetical protein
MTQLTKGQFRVGISFNPSSDPNVDAIKTAAAALIDLIDALPQQDAEQARLKSLAQTHIEDAAMWAVKAATKQPMPQHLMFEKPFTPVQTKTQLTDPFDEACREAAVAVMGSIGPWDKVAAGWQVMDMLGLIAKKGFANVHIADVYATLDKIRGQK